MKNKYPIYIVSKGRADRSLTAKFFIEDGVDFLIAVEPQEYDDYCKNIGEKYILKLPFSNLGLGSYPARNFCWEHSIQNGHDRHWIFDDNISLIRRLYKGKRIPCNALVAINIIEDFTDRYKNIAISAFNYTMFVTNNTQKPYVSNVHAYSAMLINNHMDFRWRLKYNEDVDLCLQVLHNKMCTVLFNAFMVDKVSTTAKMKGGNQTELYKNNSHDKKVLKAKSLEEIWPQYAETVIRFKRPHHYVNWKKHFQHNLIRRTDIDWDEIRSRKFNIKLSKKNEIISSSLNNIYNDYSN